MREGIRRGYSMVFMKRPVTISTRWFLQLPISFSLAKFNEYEYERAEQSYTDNHSTF